MTRAHHKAEGRAADRLLSHLASGAKAGRRGRHRLSAQDLRAILPPPDSWRAVRTATLC